MKRKQDPSSEDKKGKKTPKSSLKTAPDAISSQQLPNRDSTGSGTSGSQGHQSASASSSGDFQHTQQDAGPSGTSGSSSTSTSSAASASLPATASTSDTSGLPLTAPLDPHGGPTIMSQISALIQGEQRNMFRSMLLSYVCGCDFMKLVYDSDNGSINPTESLTDRIKRINGMSNTKFKDKFNKTIIDKMKKDKSMTSFDITTWYAVLQYACDKLASYSDDAWVTAGTLENSIKLIKDFRNALMHSSLSISDDDFREKLKEMTNLLEKAVQLWKIKFSIDQSRTDQIIKSYHSTIDVICNSPLEDLKSFDRSSVFNSLKSILKREGTADLRAFFKGFSHVNIAALLVGQDMKVEVEHIFTTLKIVKEGKEYFRNKINNVLGESNEISLDEILEIARVKGKDIILIEGVGGVGKTTIVKKLLFDWTEKSSVKRLNEIDYPLPIQCRDRNYDSVEKVVKALMPTARKMFLGEEQLMMECLFDSLLLFIFDGLDELNDASEKTFKELLGEKNKNFITICTTRPEKINDVYELISDRARVLHLRVEGVLEKNREEFIAKYCKKLQEFDDSFDEESLSGLMHYLKTTGDRMQDHWSLPINLTLLTLLWGLDRARVLSITCPTELMIKIHKLSIKKLMERLRAQKNYPLELQDKIEAFVSLLSEIALTGIRDSNLLIPSCEIQKLEALCNKLNLPSKELLGSFLMQRNSWSPAMFIPSYMFTHKAMQEFYAATHIYNQVFKGDLTKSMAFDYLLNKIESATTLQEVKEFISNWSNRPVSVKEVILRINREAEKLPSKETYQGTLTFLLGLLHAHKALVEEEHAREIIVLLNEAGVENPSDWITILNGVKCHPVVVKVILSIVNIIGEDVSIRDVNVYAYASLLEHRMPQKLSVIINRRLSDTPRIEEIFHRLAQAKRPIIYFNLMYQFYNPGKDRRFTESVNGVLRNCRIEDSYIGQVPSEDLLMNVGDEKRRGRLVVSLSSSKDADSLFSHLRRREELKRPLIVLGINVGNISSASMLQSIPQGRLQDDNIYIHLPDVKEEEEEDDENQRGRGGGGGGRRGHKWVRDILRTLLPSTQKRCFGNIYFPRYQGSSSTGIGNILKTLAGVKVSFSLIFPSRCRPLDLKEEEQLQEECKKILRCNDGIIWGSHPNTRGMIYDMDTWETTRPN